MPTTGPRASYPAVAAVVTVVTLMGLAAREFKPLIPPVVTDGVEVLDPTQPGLRLSDERIRWREFGPQAIAEARRTNRLMMILIGDRASAAYRFADRYWFTDRDLIDTMNAEFIAIRIDPDQYPAMTTSFMPFRRTSRGLDPLFQVWFVDPAGSLLDGMFIANAFRIPEANWAVTTLNNLRVRWNKLKADQTPFDLQASDIEMLNRPPVMLDFDGHAKFIESMRDPKFGGIVRDDRQLLRPMSWRYLALTGYTEELLASMRPCIASPMTDWLDGGFFRECNDRSWRQVEVDKSTQQNAAMMLTVAIAGQVLGKPEYIEVAKLTFDWLMNEMHEGDSFVGFRVGDGTRVGRSKLSSFPVRVLRENFSGEEREWLRTHFGLRVEDNPQMLMYLPHPEEVFTEEFRRFRDRLRDLRDRSSPMLTSKGRLDVTGSALARMIETAALVNDKERLNAALRLTVSLDAFKSGVNDVLHRLPENGSGDSCLADYLAYADARWQEYAVTGRIDALSDGLSVLRRAINLFLDKQSGVLKEGLWTFGEPSIPNVPSVALHDSMGESSIAAAVRLCGLYGRAERCMKIPSPTEPVNLVATANALVDRFAPIAAELQNRVSGFFGSALVDEQPSWVAVVQPSDTAAIAAAHRAHPTQYVIPIYSAGEAAPQLQKPGVYQVEFDPNGVRVNSFTPTRATPAL